MLTDWHILVILAAFSQSALYPLEKALYKYVYYFIIKHGQY